jgi:pimeloyl-ACP methyl ester carboxylesterase
VTNDQAPNAAPPVVLVHGWGGSFAATWQRSGFTALLEDAGRQVIGIDLLGHGDAPKPHDDDAYADLTARVIEALPESAVDAIGFSLGAHTLLRIAAASPQRFHRLVLAGVGRNIFERDEDSHREVVRAVEGGETTDNRARLFAQYAGQPGNDRAALAAVLRSDHAARLTEDDLARVMCRTLVAVGDQDFVLPADRLVAALPNATFRSLRRTDHFATPDSFDFIDATLEFLDALPS